MYILFGILFIICLIFLLAGWHRRRCIREKICRMDICKKVCLLNNLLNPLGFSYCIQQDIVVTKIEAWQRKFGYCSLFDRTASRFGMVFDCEPVFFYYRGRTYRIELWKGQYGINLGGEIGVYYAEGILPAEQFETARFQSVSDRELLTAEMTFYHKGHKLFENSGKHWWLTGFRVGKYCEPEDTAMRVSLCFHSQEMLYAFTESLLNMGYGKNELTVFDTAISFLYSRPHTKQPHSAHGLLAAWIQRKNRLVCKLFLSVTKPFSCTADRVLYLYFFLPIAFRHLLSGRRSRRQKFHGKKKGVRLRELP